MAADVLQAPRIARNVTNMEVAAAAARARRAPAGAHVDPDLIDSALADLEVARIFLDATDNYHDELNAWLNPKGYTPNRALHEEVSKAQTITREADDRLSLAEGRLRTALDQSYNAMPQRAASRDDVDRAYRFNEAFIPYRDAWNRGVATYLLNFPGLPEQDRDSAKYQEFEQLMEPLYDAARDAAIDTLLTPAATVVDLLLKQDIIRQQEIHCAADGALIISVMDQLVADGVVLAGGAA